MVDERMLSEEGYCPTCADPDLTVFRHDLAAYQATYTPPLDRQPTYERSQGPIAALCPHCQQDSNALVGVRHRNGRTRYVCEDCRRDALAGDHSFWHWFHHKA